MESLFLGQFLGFLGILRFRSLLLFLLFLLLLLLLLVLLLLLFLLFLLLLLILLFLLLLLILLFLLLLLILLFLLFLLLLLLLLFLIVLVILVLLLLLFLLFLLLFLNPLQGHLQIVQGVGLIFIHLQGAAQFFRGGLGITGGQQGGARIVEGFGFEILVIGQGQGPLEFSQRLFVTFQSEKSFAEGQTDQRIIGVLCRAD